ncbi:MAG: hypothetical protein N4A41_00380 [Crocinitomicaceae bacterium]|jgi:hypothetical protein|nr:hypothetical protein [Crocinitomicaceae bacterium]
MVETIITSLIGLISGGGLVSVLQYLKQRKRDSRVDNDSFLDNELNRYIEKNRTLEQENSQLRLSLDYLKQNVYEPPIIRWRRVSGRFAWVSNEAVLRFFEPLNISLGSVIGKPMDEVFKDHPKLLAEFRKLEILARSKQRAAKTIELPHLGEMLTIKVNYYIPSVGMVLETEMFETEFIRENE